MDGIVLLDDVDNNRAQWLELRKKYHTATEAPIVAGKSRWRTPLDLWLEYTGRKPKSTEVSEAMELGNAMEPLIARWFCNKVGKRLRKANALIRHKDIEWAATSLDYLVMPDAGGDEHCHGAAAFNFATDVLEIKHGNFSAVQHWSQDEPPVEHRIQTIWEEGCTGIHGGWVAGLLGGDARNFFHPRVEWDESLFNILVELFQQFDEQVRTDTPPPVTGADRDLVLNYIKRHEKLMRFPQEMRGTLERYTTLKETLSEVKAQEKVLESEVKEMQAQIIRAMGDATQGELDQYLISLKQINVKEKVTKAYSFWRMDCKLAKEEQEAA